MVKPSDYCTTVFSENESMSLIKGKEILIMILKHAKEKKKYEEKKHTHSHKYKINNK